MALRDAVKDRASDRPAARCVFTQSVLDGGSAIGTVGTSQSRGGYEPEEKGGTVYAALVTH